MIFLFVVVLLFVVFLLVFGPFLLLRFVRCEEKIVENGNYLLVIAHPDDECLFFSPIILSIRTKKYLLCLSNGSNNRADELRRSALKLGFDDLTIIDDQIYLPDNQRKFWSSEAILGHLNKSIRQWNISTIISFDSKGVSGHLNHSSIYFALVKSPYPKLHFLSLESLPIYRKYLTIFELIRIFFFKSSSQTQRTFLLPFDRCFLPHQSMFEHRSQLVWFRYLYLAFSRYIFINDFRIVY